MSIAPRIADLPKHRVPKRLRHLRAGAQAGDNYCCWRLDDLPDQDGPIGDRLHLATGKDHGQIEPAEPMHIEQFQAALAATRDQWEADEVGP